MRIVIEIASRDELFTNTVYEKNTKILCDVQKISIHMDKKSFKDFKDLVIRSLQKKCKELALTLPGTTIEKLHTAYIILCDESVVFIKHFLEQSRCNYTTQLRDNEMEIIKYFIHLEILQKHNDNLLLQCRILTPEINLLVTEAIEDMCSGCHEERANKTCTRCHLIRYCSIECQKNHWETTHKHLCKK